jgi:hypothetical protein
MLNVITERAKTSLVTRGWVGDKLCLIPIDTGACVTAARWIERQPNQYHMLETASEEALPILKEVFMTLTLGQRPLKRWVFITNGTDKLILGLNILKAYDASVGLRRRWRHLGEEEVSLWSPGLQVTPARYEGVVMAQLEPSLGKWPDRTEPRGPRS